MEKTFSLVMQQQRESGRSDDSFPSNITTDTGAGELATRGCLVASVSASYFISFLTFFFFWVSHTWCLRGSFCKHQTAYVILNKAACKSHIHIHSPQTVFKRCKTHIYIYPFTSRYMTAKHLSPSCCTQLQFISLSGLSALAP